MSDVIPKITCLLTDFLERWWEKYDRDLKSAIPTPYGMQVVPMEAKHKICYIRLIFLKYELTNSVEQCHP